MVKHFSFITHGDGSARAGSPPECLAYRRVRWVAMLAVALALGAALPSVASAASRGYKVYNLSSFPIKLNQVVSGDFGNPPAGEVLNPGAPPLDFELAYNVIAGANTGELSFAVVHDGVGIGTFRAFMNNETLTETGVYCTVDFGACDPEGTDYIDGNTLTYLDPAGTVHNFGADQAQAQAEVLNQLCTTDSSATCTFTPTSETHFVGAKHFITSIVNNDPHTEATLKYDQKDEVGSTNSIDVSLTAGTKLFDLVDTSLKITYSHSWTENSGFDVEVDKPCAPLTTCTIYGFAPMVRDTGDFTLTMGNTVWHLDGVYFDQPDQTTTVESFETDAVPISPQQQKTLPPGVTRRLAAVPYRTTRGARIVRPTLRLTISGPRTVMAGKTAIYHLTLKRNQPQSRLVYALRAIHLVATATATVWTRAWTLAQLPYFGSHRFAFKVFVPAGTRPRFCVSATVHAQHARRASATMCSSAG